MDLRRQLVAWLGALMAGLLLGTMAISLASLRGDVIAEVKASERLALALLDAGNAGPAAVRLRAGLAHAPLRHIAIGVDGATPPLAHSTGGWLARWLGLAPGPGHAVRVGDQVVHIAPNPASEIDERLADIVQLWHTLLFFSGATLFVAWYAADRALRPVRALEAGLQRLAEGAPDAALPPFALREFARVAAAIDRLAAALHAAEQGQRRLAHRLIRVQEEERRTLAMELHDEVGQTLTAISLTAAYLGRHATELDGARIDACARDLRRDVGACSGQLRAMLSRLRPHGLVGPGLASALRELLRNWQQRASGMTFSVSLPPQLPALGREQSLVLYRVVQEALTNVVRHSGAHHCLVAVAVDDTALVVRIEDDGGGMAPGAVPGCGLTGMAERLRMVGGTLQIANAPGGGVHAIARLPRSVIDKYEENAWEPAPLAV